MGRQRAGAVRQALLRGQRTGDRHGTGTIAEAPEPHRHGPGQPL
ncbi:MAG: hypothetical protein MPW14_00580 [Candidatus Manganitrophus sp.]|nr:MAG: hypothetical protein MPW14_00580 [Candidatus Manganitrophus sp.]